jgi:hypothetical protein
MKRTFSKMFVLMATAGLTLTAPATRAGEVPSAAATEEITSSTSNWVVTAVRKYLARRGAPADIGAPAKLITFDYTGETTVDGEKMWAAMLIVNTSNLHVNGYGHETLSYQFEK